MRLSQWLSKTGLRHADLAAQLGVHPVTVAKWAAGSMIPRRDALLRIASQTDGQVQPGDFFANQTGGGKNNEHAS